METDQGDDVNGFPPLLISARQAADMLGIGMMPLRDLVTSGAILRDETYIKRIKLPLNEVWRYGRAKGIKLKSPWPMPYPVMLLGFPDLFVDQLDDWLADHEGSDQIQLYQCKPSGEVFIESYQDVRPMMVFADVTCGNQDWIEVKVICNRLKEAWRAGEGRLPHTIGERIMEGFFRWEQMLEVA